ncbi:hypothetical protein [Streptomyces sp. NPDC050422]|uniref:hypothetical protein n=1 Tax=Streptomyces sp. NPDC050422 TaxID=3365614 RepID=UPI00378833BB
MGRTDAVRGWLTRPDTYTVVTHGPRGISRSTLDDIEQDSTPELRADDLVAASAGGAKAVAPIGEPVMTRTGPVPRTS